MNATFGLVQLNCGERKPKNNLLSREPELGNPPIPVTTNETE